MSKTATAKKLLQSTIEIEQAPVNTPLLNAALEETAIAPVLKPIFECIDRTKAEAKAKAKAKAERESHYRCWCHSPVGCLHYCTH